MDLNDITGGKETTASSIIGGEGGAANTGGEGGAADGADGKEGKEGAADGKDGKEGKEGAEEVVLSDEDYLAGITLGEGAEYELDTDTAKALLPVFRETGIDPAKAGALARALGDHQAKQQKEAFEARRATFEQMVKECEEAFDANDQVEIRAAVNHYIPADHPLRQLMNTGELGVDKVFLTILRDAGARHRKDNGTGLGEGVASDGKETSFGESWAQAVGQKR